MSRAETLEAVLYSNLPRMFRVAVQILRNREQAEDVCQNVAIKALQEPRFCRADFNARAWLIVTTRNTAFKVIRDNNSRLRLLDHHGDLVKPIEAQTPERIVQAKQAAHAVEKLLPQMPLAYRDVFRMTYVQRMTPHEIRHQLGLNEITVRTRLHRGHEWVAAQLGVDRRA
jgi:RNA polymerase sigma-70 factor (ECF subfamily)